MSALRGLQGSRMAGGPAEHAASVTPSDGADLTDVTVGLWIVGTTVGTLTVTMSGGEIVTFTGLTNLAGFLLPIRVSRVWATNTNVTVVALW